MKLVFDSDLGLFHVCFNHPRKLTYLYQKLNIIAISRRGKGSDNKEEGRLLLLWPGAGNSSLLPCLI
jgi:hypothetical protein